LTSALRKYAHKDGVRAVNRLGRQTAARTSIVAAHAAALNVPIVSWAAADPVGMGWAQAMARPGGMITGVFLVILQMRP